MIIGSSHTFSGGPMGAASCGMLVGGSDNGRFLRGSECC